MSDDAKERYIESVFYREFVPDLYNPKDGIDAFNFLDDPAFSSHRLRYVKTLDLLNKYADISEKKIAETGGLSGVSAFLQSKGHKIQELSGDFRYEIISSNDEFDIVFSFEVIEHIKDKDTTNFDEIVLFQFNGALTYLREMYRIIKPGGILVLTTPNANSLIVLLNILDNRNPWVFYPHVKEYAPNNLIEMAHSVGFVLEKFETMYVFFYIEKRHRDMQLDNVVKSSGFSTQDRGDDAFYLFRKPMSTISSETDKDGSL